MSLDVTARMEIHRDSKAVAAFAFEPANDPLWIGAISQADLLTLPPVGAGTQVKRRAKFLGRTIDYILEVRSFEPDHLMIMESIKSSFPMHVTYNLMHSVLIRPRRRSECREPLRPFMDWRMYSRLRWSNAISTTICDA